jgi:membrane protein YqaA with SNARE-associated domain
MLKKIYYWVLLWAKTPYGTWALFALAFAESSFFPIPPDVLLIALGIGAPKKSLRYALVCSIGSVLGGCLGYFIGWQFMEGIGNKIVVWYGLADQFDYLRNLYQTHDAWAVAIAGFTPIPYKLFTITAGAFVINFPVFVVASALSRSARFFIIGLLIYRFGPNIQYFLDRYLNLLTIVFTLLLIGSFLVIKLFF